MLNEKIGLLNYTLQNPEPKKELDKRNHNENGILSFYSDYIGNDHIILDIANYMCLAFNEPDKMIIEEDYSKNENVFTKKKDLKNFYHEKYAVIVSDKNKYLSFFDFLIKKCKEKYNEGLYCYIKELMRKCIPLYIEIMPENLYTDKLKEKLNELYEYNFFCYSIYATYINDLFLSRLRVSNLKTDNDYISFINDELNLVDKFLMLKAERSILFNNRSSSLINDKYLNLKDEILNLMIRDIVLFNKKVLVENKTFLKSYINLFNTKDLEEFEVKDSKTLNYMCIGYDRKSFFNWKIISVINDFIENRRVLNAKNINVFEKFIENKSQKAKGIDKYSKSVIIFDDEHYLFYSSFVIKIPLELLNGLSENAYKDLKIMLREKVLEIIDLEKTTNENENLLFEKSILNFIRINKILIEKNELISKKKI